MKNQIFHAEGIVLKAIPFKERDKILTLFTQDSGVIKLYVKGSYLKSIAHNILTMPLTVGEYFFTEGRSELFHFFDGSIIDQNLQVRGSLEALQLSYKMISALGLSQWPQKPAPQLYQLIAFFLKKLGEPQRHEVLLAAFLLKILRHEGVLQEVNQKKMSCSSCHTPLEAHRLRHGIESFCNAHAPSDALSFSLEEEISMLTLAGLRSFRDISMYPLSEILSNKIERLFNQFINNIL